MNKPLGTELSHETISNITEAMMDKVTQWQDRPLEAFYPVIFLDAVVVKVRDQNRDGEPPRPHRGRSRYRPRSNTCWGSGSRPLRGAKFGASVCAPELANRDLKDVLIVCCDGLTGFPEAIETGLARIPGPNLRGPF